MLLVEATKKRSSALRRLGRSERTIAFYEMWLNQLNEFLLFKELEQISLSQLRAFIDSLVERKMSKTSRRGASISIRVFFKWCLAEGLLPDNPAARLEVGKIDKRVPDTLSTADVLALINSAAASHHPERDQLLIALLTETGLRLSEIVALRVADVRREARCVFIISGKGGKQRFVPFGDAADHLLCDYLAVRDVSGDSLFGLTGSGVRLALRRIGDRCGVKATPHKFRRTSATLTARAGGGQYYLQQKFGWESAQVARFYIDLSEMEDQMLRTSPLDRFILPKR